MKLRYTLSRSESIRKKDEELRKFAEIIANATDFVQNI